MAQEVERAAKESGYDFSGVTAPKNSKDLYSMNNEEFVVPLVKAVQEQQQMIDSLKKHNDDLEGKLKALEKMLAVK
jgi:DNA integrity scanning protein DisA with diadenylate cyclase activity